MASNHTTGKFKKIFTILSGDTHCGCGNPNSTQVIDPKPVSKTHKLRYRRRRQRPSSSSSCQSNNYLDEDDDDGDSVTAYSTSSHYSRSPPDHAGGGNVEPNLRRGTVAVVKESDDPYRDFRQSMIQMMAAQDIWSSEEDLEELLKCFLRLNSPLHHEIIIRAFTEIRDGGGVSNRRR